MCVDMNLKCSSIYCKINVYHWVNSWSNTNHNHTSASFSAYVCSYFGSRLHSCPCRSTSLPLQKQNQWAADLQMPSWKNLRLSWRWSTRWAPMSSCSKAFIILFLFVFILIIFYFSSLKSKAWPELGMTWTLFLNICWWTCSQTCAWICSWTHGCVYICVWTTMFMNNILSRCIDHLSVFVHMCIGNQSCDIYIHMCIHHPSSLITVHDIGLLINTHMYSVFFVCMPR